MSRRTVVIPDEIAEQIEKIAKKERRSFSSTLSRLADEALRRRKAAYSLIGSGESGLPDLGVNAERYLDQSIVRE